VVGDLELNFETLSLPDDPDQLLRIYSAKAGSPSSDALTLLNFGDVGAHAEAAVPEPAPARRDHS
jgi:hypothetical protein